MLVKLAEVDCTTQKNLCIKYGVKGYPTVNYFDKGGDPEKYPNARTK